MAAWSIRKTFGLEDNAQILCSDPNSSNTCRINSAITFLKQYADREMAYFPSRHQIHEKVLQSVFEHGLSQVTSRLDVVFFKKKSEKNGIIWNKCLNETFSESEVLSNAKYLPNALKK
ncbi:hypothetical protein AVEN_136045-1 [Araneus ventricosus]|uniref:Uncharacterized protein n=1 Tax=Araneus ventricosus TaxID=182803 RepID=A0A4Y2EW16_ARAVE|nr:hypothetical protein AVEN_136045-1 [Araneus ventricosus]